MKILLFGRNGQVGFELCRTLRNLGNLTALGPEELDVTELEAVRATIRSQQPELIVNAAAYTAVDKAEQESELAFRVNAEFPRVLADEAHRLNAGLIHYSTDYVFNGAKPSPYTEDDLACPLNVYGASKLEGDRAILDSGAAA